MLSEWLNFFRRRSEMIFSGGMSHQSSGSDVPHHPHLAAYAPIGNSSATLRFLFLPTFLFSTANTFFRGVCFPHSFAAFVVLSSMSFVLLDPGPCSQILVEWAECPLLMCVFFWKWTHRSADGFPPPTSAWRSRWRGPSGITTPLSTSDRVGTSLGPRVIWFFEMCHPRPQIFLTCIFISPFLLCVIPSWPV